MSSTRIAVFWVKLSNPVRPSAVFSASLRYSNGLSGSLDTPKPTTKAKFSTLLPVFAGMLPQNFKKSSSSMHTAKIVVHQISKSPDCQKPHFELGSKKACFGEVLCLFYDNRVNTDNFPSNLQRNLLSPGRIFLKHAN